MVKRKVKHILLFLIICVTGTTSNGKLFRQSCASWSTGNIWLSIPMGFLAF